MAGFLLGSMGAAASANNMNAQQFEQLASTLSPDSRQRLPDTDTALSLLSDFEALSLEDSSGGAGGGAGRAAHQTSCCVQCNRPCVAAGVSIDQGTTQVDPAALSKTMSEQPFVYRQRNYCRLDCFFEAHMRQPGLCMYIDSLFSMAVKVQRRVLEGGGSVGSSKGSHAQMQRRDITPAMWQRSSGGASPNVTGRLLCVSKTTNTQRKFTLIY